MKPRQKTVILKLSGSSCNLSCGYCYERIKALRHKNNHQLLDIRHVERLICFFDSYEKLTVILHGGEPLIVDSQYLKELLKFLSALSHRRRVEVGIQTNGTASLDSLHMLLENCGSLVRSVGISVDGPEHLNDSVRFFPNGAGSWTHIRDFAKAVKELNIRTGIISVVSRANISHPREVIGNAFMALDIKGLSLSPCFELDATGQPTKWTIYPMEFLKFLQEAFLLICEEGFLTTRTINPYTNIFRRLLGMHPTVCLWDNEHKCQPFITLYPGGHVYPCDEWARTPAHRFLSLESSTPVEDDQLVQLSEFEAESYTSTEFAKMEDYCSRCVDWPICGGGCFSKRSIWYHLNRDFFSEYCDYRRSIISFIKSTIQSAVTDTNDFK
jgi:uncharacterized protein